MMDAESSSGFSLKKEALLLYYRAGWRKAGGRLLSIHPSIIYIRGVRLSLSRDNRIMQILWNLMISLPVSSSRISLQCQSLLPDLNYLTSDPHRSLTYSPSVPSSSFLPTTMIRDTPLLSDARSEAVWCATSSVFCESVLQSFELRALSRGAT